MKSRHLIFPAVVLALTTIGGTANAAGAGIDLSVSLGGNFPGGPNSFGNFGVDWTNSGTADVTGTTHLTLHLPPGLTTDGALMYAQPANYEFTERVSPDGHELDATFIGTMTPGQSDFMKVEVDSGTATPSANAVATVSNPADTDPADNRASVPVSPPDQASTPLPAAPPPVVTSISVSSAAPASVPGAASNAPDLVLGAELPSGPAAGGTSVVVRGSHLGDGFVRFGARLANTTSPSAPAPNFACTDTECTVTTAPEAASPPVFALVPVTVTTPGGTSLITPRTLFRYFGPPPAGPAAPTVKFLSASSGPAGAALVIGGTGLDQGQVFFGAVPGRHSSCGTTLCTATAPAGTGQVEVVVRTEGGSSGLPFTYT